MEPKAPQMGLKPLGRGIKPCRGRENLTSVIVLPAWHEGLGLAPRPLGSGGRQASGLRLVKILAPDPSSPYP